MLKVSAQILWIFTNHLVNFWVQCTSQTKCSSAVYIYTYTSHETEFGLQKPQQQSSRSGVNCEWCLRATWMIFETRGARHESLQREGAEITCGWFWFWCRSNKSATDPTDQLYNVPICREWRSISPPNTITLSTFILIHHFSNNWSHFDLNHGSELIEENVINASLRIWIRKYEKIITISGFIFWNPYRGVWLIQTRLLMDGLRGVRTRFIPPGTGRPRLQAANLD